MSLSRITVVSLFFSAALVACGEGRQEVRGEEAQVSSMESQSLTKGEMIIDEAIRTSGGEKYEEGKVEFTFRKKKYSYERSGSEFSYTRLMEDELGKVMVKDHLSNQGFQRTIDGQLQSLPDSLIDRYSNAVNSVFYFALLPYGLNDAAVNKKYIGETTIKGAPYHKVFISFNEEGGGEDFEDTFIYWIHTENKTVDYLAYKYHVNEGGIRFREAFNIRTVGGLRFVDYNNYKPLGDYRSIDLATTDKLFEEGKLKLLSKIILEDITVQ